MEQEFIATNSTRRYQGPAVNEFIAAMKAAWGEDPVHFEGKFYTIPSFSHQSQAGPKGRFACYYGRVFTLAIKRAARYADGFNPALFSWEALEKDVKTFRTAAQEAGRDPSQTDDRRTGEWRHFDRTSHRNNRPFLIWLT